ncbi:sulfurtransferase [Glaciecola siphonariae]|uniref:Sulfurtransferase n=1 Tax=Glaciecola siphonariae TaxID=521012 RepID=A0ABV9LTT5_9ALTE
MTNNLSQSIASQISIDEYVALSASPVLLYTTMVDAPADKPDIVKQRPDALIPNSLLFDFQSVIRDTASSLSNMMPSVDVFEREVRRLGINIGDEIVVYDDFGNFCASRVWFMFKSMGHDNIRVLEGGLPQWHSRGLNTQALAAKPIKKGSFVATPNPQYQFVDSDFIAKSVVKSVAQATGTHLPLLDARSQARFSGKEKLDAPNMRSGHIPNSVNIPYRHLQCNNGGFLPIDALKHVFTTALTNYESQSAMAFTCGSGVTACILAQAADALGHSPLYVYDGSWSDWGAQHHLPISTGE